MDQIRRLMQGMRGGMGQAAPPTDQPLPDTAEKIQISSLSLLKMLKHGRAGVPMEVMGLMLGEFVDEYTITCVDVFAMPQVSPPGKLALLRLIDDMIYYIFPFCLFGDSLFLTILDTLYLPRAISMDYCSTALV